MENFNEVVKLNKRFLAEVEAYERRPSKAESKRMRASLNQIKKLVTSAKADLLVADKG